LETLRKMKLLFSANLAGFGNLQGFKSTLLKQLFYQTLQVLETYKVLGESYKDLNNYKLKTGFGNLVKNEFTLFSKPCRFWKPARF
jgi:hypothetical protein